MSFLEITASEGQARRSDLHNTDLSLPACTDSHLPGPNVPATPQEAEAEPEPRPGTECDASRGGTLEICKGHHMNCVMIGEYTGPPIKTD